MEEGKTNTRDLSYREKQRVQQNQFVLKPERAIPGNKIRDITGKEYFIGPNKEWINKEKFLADSARLTKLCEEAILREGKKGKK